MPYQRDCVPEDKGWVPSCFTGVHLISPIVLCYGDLHKLGDVQDERQDGDRNDVDHHTFGVGHRLKSEEE